MVLCVFMCAMHRANVTLPLTHDVSKLLSTLEGIQIQGEDIHYQSALQLAQVRDVKADEGSVVCRVLWAYFVVLLCYVENSPQLFCCSFTCSLIFS